MDENRLVQIIEHLENAKVLLQKEVNNTGDKRASKSLSLVNQASQTLLKEEKKK